MTACQRCAVVIFSVVILVELKHRVAPLLSVPVNNGALIGHLFKGHNAAPKSLSLSKAIRHRCTTWASCAVLHQILQMALGWEKKDMFFGRTSDSVAK